MRKVFIILFFGMIPITNNAQTQNNLSIKEIHKNVISLATSLKKEGQLDKMYINLDEKGNRWLYIENKSLEGFRSDQSYVSLKISKIILKMIYHSIYYNREETTSLKGFTNIMKSKNIMGVQFKTHDNDFFFMWDEVLNFNE